MNKNVKYKKKQQRKVIYTKRHYTGILRRTTSLQGAQLPQIM